MISGDFWQEPFQLKTISPNWENAPSGAGIYVVRRDSPIPRVVAEDPKGVLYVGRSKRLRNRLWQLWKANHPASGFLWGHPKLAGEIMGGICRSPKDVVDRVGELTVKVATLMGPSELEDAERAVLYAYFYQYGELPPLNFRLPKRWNEPPSDEWIGWGNEGLT